MTGSGSSIFSTEFRAIGKPTKVNELDEIGVALAKFINTAAEEEAGR